MRETLGRRERPGFSRLAEGQNQIASPENRAARSREEMSLAERELELNEGLRYQVRRRDGEEGWLNYNPFGG